MNTMIRFLVVLEVTLLNSGQLCAYTSPISYTP